MFILSFNFYIYYNIQRLNIGHIVRQRNTALHIVAHPAARVKCGTFIFRCY